LDVSIGSLLQQTSPLPLLSHILTHPDPITSVCQTNDTNAILLSTLDSTIRLLDKGNGVVLQTYTSHVNSDYRIRSCLGLNDAYVVSGSEDGKIYVWDLLDGKVVSILEGGAKAGKVVSAVVFHKAQKSFLSAGADGMLSPPS
jgi:mitogen-activated protein kinase organizer 1